MWGRRRSAAYDQYHMATPSEPLSGPLPAELKALLPPALHALCTQQRLGEDGEMVVLQRTRQGLLAEASLQTERYHCDAVVVADALVSCVPRAALLAALAADAGFALRWIGMLNREVKRLRQQSEWLSLNTVQARLLHLLRTEGDADGLPLPTGLKTLAREIGVTHEALYRCVAALKQYGVLVRVAGKLQLRPPVNPDPTP